jgi:triosephosphate isomerase
MRTPLVAGNWKMHLLRSEAEALAAAIVSGAPYPGVEVALCPPFPYLPIVAAALAGSRVELGAQDVFFEPQGAFTGEVSAPMLADVGCRYVIVGHSERRQFFGETDAGVGRKALAVWGARMTPIICLGELLAEREAGQTAQVVGRQFEAAFAEVTPELAATAVIAYEPVWAIGTGRVATPEQAEEVHADLRNRLAGRYNHAIAQAARILYGGSVKADNAGALLRQPNVDGALVGGASLKAAEFQGILRAAGEAPPR